MIPSEIYELACALVEEFDLDFSAAVKSAWAVARTLESEGYAVMAKDLGA